MLVPMRLGRCSADCQGCFVPISPAHPQWNTSSEAIATCCRDKVTDKPVCRMHSREHPCESNGAEGEAGAHLSVPVPASPEGPSACRHGCGGHAVCGKAAEPALGRAVGGVQCHSRLSPCGSSTTRQHAWSKHPLLKAVISTGKHFPPQAHFVTSGHIFGGQHGGREGGWTEARGAEKDPTKHRTASQQGNDLKYQQCQAETAP